MSVRVPEDRWSSLCTCKVPSLTVMPPDMLASLLTLDRTSVPLPVFSSDPLPPSVAAMVAVPELVKLSVVPPPRVMVVPPLMVMPEAASALNVRLSLMARLPARPTVLLKLLEKISVWLPVASAAAMATASLILTPSLTLTVAVSLVLVT
ncbi:hypothetical protein D9M70_543320 [compost metagenome]